MKRQLMLALLVVANGLAPVAAEAQAPVWTKAGNTKVNEISAGKGQVFALDSRGDLVKWDGNGWQRDGRINGAKLTVHPATGNPWVIEKDGDCVEVINGRAQNRGKPVSRVSDIRDFAASPDGEVYAIGSDQLPVRWDGRSWSSAAGVDRRIKRSAIRYSQHRDPKGAKYLVSILPEKKNMIGVEPSAYNATVIRDPKARAVDLTADGQFWVLRDNGDVLKFRHTFPLPHKGVSTTNQKKDWGAKFPWIGNLTGAKFDDGLYANWEDLGQKALRIAVDDSRGGLPWLIKQDGYAYGPNLSTSGSKPKMTTPIASIKTESKSEPKELTPDQLASALTSSIQKSSGEAAVPPWKREAESTQSFDGLDGLWIESVDFTATEESLIRPYRVMIGEEVEAGGVTFTAINVHALGEWEGSTSTWPAIGGRRSSQGAEISLTTADGKVITPELNGEGTAAVLRWRLADSRRVMSTWIRPTNRPRAIPQPPAWNDGKGHEIPKFVFLRGAGGYGFYLGVHPTSGHLVSVTQGSAIQPARFEVTRDEQNMIVLHVGDRHLNINLPLSEAGLDASIDRSSQMINGKLSRPISASYNWVYLMKGGSRIGARDAWKTNLFPMGREPEFSLQPTHLRDNVYMLRFCHFHPHTKARGSQSPVGVNPGARDGLYLMPHDLLTGPFVDASYVSEEEDRKLQKAGEFQGRKLVQKGGRIAVEFVDAATVGNWNPKSVEFEKLNDSEKPVSLEEFPKLVAPLVPPAHRVTPGQNSLVDITVSDKPVARIVFLDSRTSDKRYFSESRYRSPRTGRYYTRRSTREGSSSYRILLLQTESSNTVALTTDEWHSSQGSSGGKSIELHSVDSSTRLSTVGPWRHLRVNGPAEIASVLDPYLTQHNSVVLHDFETATQAKLREFVGGAVHSAKIGIGATADLDSEVEGWELDRWNNVWKATVLHDPRTSKTSFSVEQGRNRFSVAGSSWRSYVFTSKEGTVHGYVSFTVEKVDGVDELRINITN